MIYWLKLPRGIFSGNSFISKKSFSAYASFSQLFHFAYFVVKNNQMNLILWQVAVQWGYHVPFFPAFSAMYSVQCTVSKNRVQCRVYSVYCTVCSVRCAVFSAQCAVCSVPCPVCNVQCAVCSEQCPVCSIQCVVCSAVCSEECQVSSRV